jgi:16S rRNA U516 pseudouridylate synthase RsuA-like enzyme
MTMYTDGVPVLSFRVTDGENEQIKREAEAAGMSVSEWVRYRTLGAASPASARYDALASRVETLEGALRLAGLEQAIKQARSVIERKEDGDGKQ